jgi:hypothetical protein
MQLGFLNTHGVVRATSEETTCCSAVVAYTSLNVLGELLGYARFLCFAQRLCFLRNIFLLRKQKSAVQIN